MKRFLVCLICLLFVNSCNSTMICMPRAKKVEVEDLLLKHGYQASSKVNIKGEYCLLYRPWNYKLNIKNFDIYIINNQIVEILKEHNIKIKEQELKPNMTEKETETFKNNIMEREKNNNYKNCDYLITYYVTTSTEEKNICSSNLHIVMQVVDIKTNNEITSYSLSKGAYKKQQEKVWTKNLIDGLFKYQSIPNNKKTTTIIECTRDGCRTIKCVGDKCEINNH